MAHDVEIVVDGRPLRVSAGTTLASALFDAGVTSFRTSVRGEPRAPICGMGICHECRVTVNGRAHERSCLITCSDGMVVGTGASPQPAGDDAWRGTPANATSGGEWDVAVVGGGPAGIAAATRAAESGARVVVVDTGIRPGGQIWRHRDSDGRPRSARRWMDRCAQSGATWMAASTVIGGSAADGLLVSTGERATRVRASAVVLATGARELFLPFPGWTLPGVMGAGGLQALVKGGMRVAGRRVVVAGSGPLLLAAAATLVHAGARVIAVVEQAPLHHAARFAAGLWVHPSKLVQAAGYAMALRGSPPRFGTWLARADGTGRVERVTLTDGRRQWEERCDLVCCSYGLVPSTELARWLGCDVARGAVVVDARQRTSVPNVYCAGEPTGVAGELAAIVEGEIAGYAAAGDDARAVAPRLQRARVEWRRTAHRIARDFRVRDEIRELADAETLVCRCEDVPRAALDPAWSAREAKLYTRVGMGPCQGAVCGAACATLFGWLPGVVRPPLAPASVGVLADPDEGA